MTVLTFKISMIGDNVVLRPPRLSEKDSTPITFAVRVARPMRWVSKSKVQTRDPSDPAEKVELW